MRNSLTYAIDDETGHVWSFLRSDPYMLVGPILDYDAMTPANNFATFYTLQRMRVDACELRSLRRVRCHLPRALRNLHRAMWGRDPLPMVDPAQLALPMVTSDA